MKFWKKLNNFFIFFDLFKHLVWKTINPVVFTIFFSFYYENFFARIPFHFISEISILSLALNLLYGSKYDRFIVNHDFQCFKMVKSFWKLFFGIKHIIYSYCSAKNIYDVSLMMHMFVIMVIVWFKKKYRNISKTLIQTFYLRIGFFIEKYLKPQLIS